MCKKKENKRSQRTEKIEPYVFFSRHEYLSTYVQRDTERKKSGRERYKATVCLARPTKKEKKDDNNSKEKRKKERATIMHTHTHTHIKNGTRDEVREKW